MKEQSVNRRSNHFITYNGETKTIAEWAEELNIKYDTLYARLFVYKFSVEKAMTKEGKQ